MVVCENDKGVVHLWDPSWEKPKIVDFKEEIPGGKILGKSVVRWFEFERPCVFFSDEQDCLVACLDEGVDGVVPWDEGSGNGISGYGDREESPLQLVPAEKGGKGGKGGKLRIEDLITDKEGSFGDMGMNMSGGSEEVDDTFQFRRFVD